MKQSVRFRWRSHALIRRYHREDMRIQPASMKIKMEDKIEETFGIVATTSGNAAKGFEVGSTTVLTEIPSKLPDRSL